MNIIGIQKAENRRKNGGSRGEFNDIIEKKRS